MGIHVISVSLFLFLSCHGDTGVFFLCSDALNLIASIVLSPQVTVTMDVVNRLCTTEAIQKSVHLTLLAKGNSATPAYFSVVPLTVGEFPITITDFDTVLGYSDSIRKNLNVVVGITS